MISQLAEVFDVLMSSLGHASSSPRFFIVLTSFLSWYFMVCFWDVLILLLILLWVTSFISVNVTHINWLVVSTLFWDNQTLGNLNQQTPPFDSFQNNVDLESWIDYRVTFHMIFSPFLKRIKREEERNHTKSSPYIQAPPKSLLLAILGLYIDEFRKWILSFWFRKNV